MKPLYLALLFVSLVLFAQCKKDDDDNTVNGKTFIIDATNSSRWIYFSFEKNDTIHVVNPKSSTEWDLAFKRFYIRTNSGLSGSGTAGADSTYSNGEAGFSANKITTVNTVFASDIEMPVIAHMGMANDTVNPVLYRWFNYSQTTNQIVPTDKIFMVKTTNGKFAKVWFVSYYNDISAKSGYIKMRYMY